MPDKKEIKRILIANRGEIALRAIRTIKEMGKECVAVYSTADKDNSYLKFADASICIGEAQSNKSYLNIASIISASEVSECDAVFPGYGFLSENHQFAEICKFHNIDFLGPSAEVINMMGNKTRAKEAMRKVGVPVVPGTDSAITNINEVKKIAKEIGYPVILKAAAGGGGRGMRVVHHEDSLESSYISAESEALSSFNDGSIYLEKFIENPRHIEAQIISDKYGNTLHFGVRDCSLQRRHQKVIEEAQADFIPDQTAKKILEISTKAASAIGYVGAGTFEYLVDKHGDFYFIEMNTRLQVEHTVSEAISNCDFVRMMIEVAEGKELPPQDKIELKGHSIECRITAENPIDFTPSPGTITKFVAPGGMHVRLDTHVHASYKMPVNYDSMIGKLIVWGHDRNEAINRMRRALEEFQIEGIKTTIPFHLAMMKNEDFKKGNFDTGYLGKMLKL